MKWEREYEVVKGGTRNYKLQLGKGRYEIGSDLLGKRPRYIAISYLLYRPHGLNYLLQRRGHHHFPRCDVSGQHLGLTTQGVPQGIVKARIVRPKRSAHMAWSSFSRTEMLNIVKPCRIGTGRFATGRGRYICVDADSALLHWHATSIFLGRQES